MPIVQCGDRRVAINRRVADRYAPPPKRGRHALRTRGRAGRGAASPRFSEGVAMRVAVLLAVVVGMAGAQARAEDSVTVLCRSNPAYSSDVMKNVLQAQLEKDHDPALDAESPDQMAAEAAEQGVKDCAGELRGDQPLYQTLSVLSGPDLQVGWDAFNTACSDHTASKAACVKAEVGAVRALKRMVATNQPPGAKALVETCVLVLKTDPPMADWRECVDAALAVHAAADQAARCKTSVPWHNAKSGADAGAIMSACLRGH